MNLIKIGMIVNTHGIKGELRIISDFEYKEKVFIIGNKLYINDEEFIINNYRPHKKYDMVTFKGFKDILEVLKYKGKEVYFDRYDLNLNEKEFLDEDLIGLEVVYKNKIIGNIDNIERNSGSKLFIINDKLIPYKENFIECIEINKKKIILKNLEGLI